MREYNKLVRDNIPKIIEQDGNIPITRILDDEEYLKELDKKLLEEVNEYLNDQNIEELADIYEVLLAILKARKIELEELEKVRKEKVLKKGAFEEKIYLEREI